MSLFGLFGPPDIEKLTDKKDVPGLIQALSYPKDAVIRRMAAERLGAMKDSRAVDRLMLALHDEDPSVRSSSALALRDIGNKQAVETLMIATQDPVASVRLSATRALCDLGDTRAIEAMILVLQADSDSASWVAAEALGKFGDSRAIDPLIAALRNPRVRGRAAESLLTVGDGRAAGPLFEAFKHRNGDVRKSVARALAKLGDTPAARLAPQLVEADRSRRETTVMALKQIGDEQAVDLLIGALDDEDAAIRLAALNALQAIQTPYVVEQLCMAYQDYDRAVFIRSDLAGALAEIGDDRAVETLIAVLKNMQTVAESRQIAAKALGETGAAQAVEPLITAFNTDPDSSVRRSAAEALGAIGDTRAVEPLLTKVQTMDSTDDPHAPFWKTLGEALGRVADDQALETLTEMALGKAWHQRPIAIRALGWSSDARALGTIVKFYRSFNPGDEAGASTIAAALKHNLERNLTRANLEDLQAILSFGDFLVYTIPYPENCDLGPINLERSFEIGHIRQLARQELIRRGALA